MGDRADRLCYDMSDDAAKSGGMAKRLGDEALDLASRAEEIRAQRLVDDARHWRRRAEEIRTEAETMGESIARATMLGTAESYEKLADQIEERLGEVKRFNRARYMPRPSTD